LAVVGARGYRDRWVGSWLVLGGIGFLLMLGRYTFLMDLMPHVPIVGSGRVPVRYHLWLVVAAAALAAVGVDRIGRIDLGPVSLRGAAAVLAVILVVSCPIMYYIYYPAWAERHRWPLAYQASQFSWLRSELAWAYARAFVLALAAWTIARKAIGASDGRRRAAAAALLPLLLMADLLAAHWNDVPTVDPSYWTSPPQSARWLLERPDLNRIYGESWRSSGEPAYASIEVNFPEVREMLAWSLPPVWRLQSTGGETPIKSTRRLRFTGAAAAPWRYDVESLSYVVARDANADLRLGPGTKIGPVSMHPNPDALPRARLVGRVRLVGSEGEAVEQLKSLREALATTIVVEEPGGRGELHSDDPGTARITRDAADRVDVDVEAREPAYLLLADTYDPGWSATVDGQEVPIRPADLAFRAVRVEAGHHRVVFQYKPAGLRLGLGLTAAGALLSLVLAFWPWRAPELEDEHGASRWWAAWPVLLALAMVVIFLASLVNVRRDGSVGVQSRWDVAAHQFTWGAGLKAMRPVRDVEP
jgi:hypothetical protein